MTNAENVDIQRRLANNADYTKSVYIAGTGFTKLLRLTKAGLSD